MTVGAKMATQQNENCKTPKKNVFFIKIPQNFELLKQALESSHQTGLIYIGTLILSLSAFPRNVFYRRSWLT